MAHKVGDIMTIEVITVEVDASLDEAQALMEAEDVRRLPVVDEDGDLVGILSWGDLREATSVAGAQTPNPYAPDAEEEWLTVWEAMTHNPLVVTRDTDLVDAVEMMVENKIAGLPVVESQTGPGRRHLTGIVTESDIFRLLIRLWRNEE